MLIPVYCLLIMMAFRLAGWTLVIIGLALFMWTGGLGDDYRNVYAWVGTFVFLLGMILTSFSALVGTLQYRRRLRERMDQVRPGAPGTKQDPGGEG